MLKEKKIKNVTKKELGIIQFLTLLVASFGSLGNPFTEFESIERKIYHCRNNQNKMMIDSLIQN